MKNSEIEEERRKDDEIFSPKSQETNGEEGERSNGKDSGCELEQPVYM